MTPNPVFEAPARIAAQAPQLHVRLGCFKRVADSSPACLAITLLLGETCIRLLATYLFSFFIQRKFEIHDYESTDDEWHFNRVLHSVIFLAVLRTCARSGRYNASVHSSGDSATQFATTLIE